jgi:subtilase family serine protease
MDFGAHRTGLIVTTLMLGLSACSAAAPQPPQSAAGKVFVENRLDPKIRAEALASGHPISPDTSMRVHVYVTPLDKDEFNRLLSGPEDSHSPKFGHQLTLADLKRFERPLSQYEDIERWLSSYGIKTLSADPEASVRTIRTEGTAGQFERALNIVIEQSANNMWFANMSDPQIPEDFNGIIGGFAGLDDLTGYGGGPKIGVQ